MSTGMRLLMAQVDDVPGELLGEFMQRVDELGAYNVHIVASITKKNRPGYLVYVDVPDDLEDAVAELFGSELGTWGYRVLASEHKHFNVERLNIVLTVEVQANSWEFELHAKSICRDNGVKRLKAEHGDLSAICAELRRRGHGVPLAVLKTAVESQLQQQGDSTRATVRF